MSWTVRFADEFDTEFADLSESVQDELLAQAKVLERFGPQASRPRVDTHERFEAREHERAAI